MLLMRRVTVCLLLSLLGGCATYTLPGSKPAPVETPDQPTVVTPPPTQPERPAPPAPEPPATAAWQPLLEKAGKARDRGDYEQALALLERAQRIDPDSAEIYLALAQTHAARGDYGQAAATAERGLLYCDTAAQCTALRGFTR